MNICKISPYIIYGYCLCSISINVHDNHKHQMHGSIYHSRGKDGEQKREVTEEASPVSVITLCLTNMEQVKMLGFDTLLDRGT